MADHAASPRGVGVTIAHSLPPKLVRLRQVLDRVGVSRSTLYEMVRRGEFPQQRRLSIRCVGWVESEVDAWIMRRVHAMA